MSETITSKSDVNSVACIFELWWLVVLFAELAEEEDDDLEVDAEATAAGSGGG